MTQTLTGGPGLTQQRNLVTEVPGPRSRERLARKKTHVADGVGTALPVFVEAAGGGVLRDVDGNTLIDLGSGIAVTTVGNSAEAVVRRVREQLDAFTHTCFMVTPYDAYVDVCEALAEVTPGDHAKKSALFNSGSEAVENAVKIARVATGRDAVVVFDHAYHGRTNLTMAMTAKNMPYKSGFGPFASEVYRAPLSYPYRDSGLDGPAAARRAIDTIEKQIGADNLAALVIEPIQGEGGFIVPADGFLPTLVEWCQANGVVFDHAYHGRTNLTMAMTAKVMPYKHGFGPFAAEVYRAPMSYPLRDGLGGEEAAARAIEVVEKQVGADNLACMVIEPVQGEGGFVVPAPGFLPALARWCREHGVVLVADEVQSGFCRTGDWFACDHEGVVPDLVTTAKGIAGGLPLAAVTGRAELMDAVHTGGLGGTYGGNPLACAAALGALEEMRTHDLVGRAREVGTILHERLAALAAEHAVVAEVRGRGAMVAVELCVPGTTEPDAARTAAVAAACHAAGVVVLTCGTFGNVLRLLPPLSTTDALLHEGLDVLAEAFATTA